MKDQEKTKEQLVAELAEMRRQVTILKAAEADCKKAEADLVRSKAILQATIESLPLDFFALGPDGRYMMQNAASRRHWGDAIGKRPEDAAGTAENLSIWLANNRRAFAGEKVEEEVELTVQGEKRFSYNVIAPIREDDRIAGILGINIDITERKQAQEALQKAHDELERKVAERAAELSQANKELAVFKQFVEAAGEGFAMADLNHQVTNVNPAMLRLMGLHSSEQAVVQNLMSLHSEYVEATIREVVIPTLLRGGHWTGEIPIRSRAGQKRQALAHAFLVRNENGEPSHYGVVVTDITERKQAEEALRQSHDELRVIYDEMMDGLAVVDMETGAVVRANDALCRLLGFSEEALMARTPEQRHPPEAMPRLREHFAAKVQGTETRFAEMPCLTSDGRVRYFDTNATRIVYRGRPSFLLFMHDVTERRQAQAALERERQTLKHMLQSSDHERQLIAYEIHDGLAQYLAGSIMQFEVYKHLRETKPKDAANAYDAGMTMLRQGHADARRLISGVRPPILDEDGIVAAVTHLVNEHRRQDGSKIEFRSDVEFDRLVLILENAAYRIVQEALTNACKHSKSKRIEVELVQQGDVLRLKIEDWGVGFNPGEVAEDCFGLAGMRERARLLGGSITVESTPGQGTCIAAELPLMERG